MGPQRLTVRESYLKYAGWDPWTGWDQDRFDFDMVTKIEPALKALGGGVFLMDYPSQAASLAKLSKIDNFRASSERPSGGLSPCERGLSPLASKEGAILYRIVKDLYHSDPSVDLVFTILTHRSVWY